MIKEIYIDNYRCLVNFRINPESFQLWMGDNGGGKTSVLDVLRSIQRILTGDHVEDVFSEASLTSWISRDKRPEQEFGVTLDIGGEKYSYALTILHNIQEHRCRIKAEKLTWNGNTFFQFDGKDAHLYRINRDTKAPEEGTSFTADWNRSMISTIAERDDNAPLILFREEVRKWLIVQPVPLVVKQVAEAETRSLSRYAENFAQWYRHVLQENPGIAYKTREYLRDVLPGFEELSLKESGEFRRLRATFRINNKDNQFDFVDLSDGQRQLIVLYTILETVRQKTHSVVLIDEPDNFVSLREIKPWLAGLQELCEDHAAQAILISHHPTIVNHMVRGNEVWFSRKQGAHTVTRPYPTTPGLTPAETMERGWDDE